MISIIIPNFNKEKYICDTLLSVMNQQYSDWECIIIDDQSIDQSFEKAKQFAKNDTRFVFLKRPISRIKGPSTCRNIGIENAKGEFIIFLDSDDLLAPFCLKNRLLQFEFFPKADFLVFQMERFLTNPITDLETKAKKITNGNELSFFLQNQSLWQVTAPIYKTIFLKKINGFNQELIKYEDIELASTAIFNAKTYEVFDNIDSYYRNDQDYKTRYSNQSEITLAIQYFIKLIDLFDEKIISKTTDLTLQNQFKSNILVAYKKLFVNAIMIRVDLYGLSNKIILDFFSKKKYLNLFQRVKYYFVHFILFKFYKIKGFGLFKLIKLIYK